VIEGLPLEAHDRRRLPADLRKHPGAGLHDPAGIFTKTRRAILSEYLSKIDVDRAAPGRLPKARAKSLAMSSYNMIKSDRASPEKGCG
jgi:hypothetical protein